MIADLSQTASTINKYQKLTKSRRIMCRTYHAAPRRAGIGPIAPPACIEFVVRRNIRDAAEQARHQTFKAKIWIPIGRND